MPTPSSPERPGPGPGRRARTGRPRLVPGDRRPRRGPARRLGPPGSATWPRCPVTSPTAHRAAAGRAARRPGGLDLLVNNASRLGPSPQPCLAELPA